MFTVCLRYGRDRYEAQEILQEAFIKIFSSLHQYRNEGAFEGWIRRVVVTTALQYLRSRSGAGATLSIEGDVSNELQDRETIESDLSNKELLALVQALPATYRVIFNLYVFEGFQHKEIAGMLGISEGTSKSNLHDARRWLKEKIMAGVPANQFKRKCL